MHSWLQCSAPLICNQETLQIVAPIFQHTGQGSNTTVAQLPAHAFVCWLANIDIAFVLQDVHNQLHVAERDQASLSQNLEKITAWGNQVAEVTAALAGLSQHFDSYSAMQFPGCSLPEESLRHLSNLFHEVCTLQYTCVCPMLLQDVGLCVCNKLGMTCLLWCLKSMCASAVCVCLYSCRANHLLIFPFPAAPVIAPGLSKTNISGV